MNYILSIVLIVLLANGLCCGLTNYEYYTKGGIKEGLKAEGDHFTLNGRQITLLSGSLHYFRLPHQYWRDRLRKFKSAGLNTVQIYSPWNLHEEQEGHFDFETGFLNLAQFLKTAKEEDLFVYYRIGPYICAEWEFGGYPSWLLKDRNMKFRSNYKGHLDAVNNYFTKALSVINDFQFTKGGPIIALQFENEYGGIRNKDDLDYFNFMKNVIDKSGFKELLSNCDNGPAPFAAQHTQPGVLETFNGNSNMYNGLMELKKAQPNKPLHVTEFWPGWFDFWGDQNHHTMSLDKFEDETTQILFKANSSINFYMFFGGTNFGFTNGGDGTRAVVTSYDYNAPLSESGNYTDKYWKTRDLIMRLSKERKMPNINIPEPPIVESSAAYGVIKIKDYITYDHIINEIEPKTSDKVKPMEDFNQTFGYILYRIAHKKFNHVKLPKGVSDIGIVLVDSKEKTTVETNKDVDIEFSDTDFDNKTSDHILDIMVENMGRANGGNFNSQYKGLNADVVVDTQVANNYQVFSLDFKQNFVQMLKKVKGMPYELGHKQLSPTLYRAELDVKGQPKDTFIRTDNWKKGIVLVNGFNIGRYNTIGPQKTLYLPSPLLRSGLNDIFVFELHLNSDQIESVDRPDLGK